MKHDSDLRRRLRSLETLSDAVRAMKSLSAHHFREARDGVEPARIYREAIERIVHESGAMLAGGDGERGLLVIGGELGLCGAYNARIVAAAIERRQELGPGPTMCVGHRAALLLGRRGVALTRVYAAPTSVRGVTELLLRLIEDLLTAHVAEWRTSLDVVSARFAGVGRDHPVAARLLPIEPARARRSPPPARYVTRDHLTSVAVRELLYITVYDLLIDALACEHGARLLATQSAERWLDAQRERLERRRAAAHREAGTQEALEIATGARVRDPARAQGRSVSRVG